MKKRRALWTLLGISLVLAGCVVPSVYPFYTEKNLAFDESLVGTWVKSAKDDTNTWIFTKSGEKEYRLVIEDEKPAVFSTHLFKLADFIFMDCVPTQNISGDLPGISSHYLLKIAQIQPTLKWSTLNYKWVADSLEKNPGALRHIVSYAKPDDTNSAYVILTGETKELQKFIRAHANNTNAFIDLDDMKRVASK